MAPCGTRVPPSTVICGRSAADVYVIIDSETRQRAYIGAWLSLKVVEVKVAELKRTYPHMADRYEILEID